MNASTTRRRTASWVTVAKHEMTSQLTDKTFWIGTITTLALVAIGIAVGILASGGASASKVAVGSDEAAQIVARAAADGAPVEALIAGSSDLRALITDGDADAALLEAPDGGWQVIVQDLTDAPDLQDAAIAVQLERNAAALGVDPAELTDGMNLTVVPLDGDDDGAAAVILATVAFSVLFMLAAITYGMQIAQSVVTEKESRIVEILAAAVPVRQLLIGKLVGNSLMALGQVVLIVVASLIGLSLTDFSHLLSVVAPVVGWFVVFFLVGFASLACLWAAAGAMATRVQDLSQTTTPLTMIIMLVYFAGVLAKGTWATVLSYVPIASTVTMPGRLMSGEATWVDALLALVIAVAFMAAMIWVGDRIYRRGLLQTGSVLNLRTALHRER